MRLFCTRAPPNSISIQIEQHEMHHDPPGGLGPPVACLMDRPIPLDHVSRLLPYPTGLASLASRHSLPPPRRASDKLHPPTLLESVTSL